MGMSAFDFADFGLLKGAETMNCGGFGLLTG